MSVQNPERVVTKQDLADFYGQILPYLGGMPEVLANKFSKGDMYSTDEKMIGQWIDGKPLYQKCYNISPSKGADVIIDNDFSGKTLVKHSTVFNGIANTTSNFIPDFSETLYINESNKLVYYCDRVSGSTWWNELNSAVLIVQYTKTTDSPISIGSDTDYSTTEKIVGTWIDGRPIWQKTVDFGSQQTLTSQTWFETNIDCSNISTLVNALCLDSPYNVKAFNASIQNGTLKLMTFRASDDYVRVVTLQYTKSSS